ncbi:thioredoxin [Candidatus Dependentiae bacterium]|nr:thioredoxin [Candidatus Dependentiae bacterium]
MINVTKQNFEEVIKKATKPVVLDAFATWCGPCMYMMPIVEELEQEFGNKYIFAKLNVDESRDIAISYQVSSVPTFVFIKNNQVVDKVVGSMSKDALKAKIEQAFK